MIDADDRNRTDRIALALLLAAIVLYLPGIVWGLPFATDADRIRPWGSDELAPIGALAQVWHIVFHGGSAFDPRYPLLPYLIQAVFMAPYLAWLRLTGGMEDFSPEYPYGLTDPVTSLAALTVVARISSLLMMSAVPAIAYLSVKRFADGRTAVLAAVFTMLLYPMFYYSRTSNGDAGSLMWMALALYVVAGVLRDGLSNRRAAWLGVFAALATATKDQNYAVFLAIGLAVVALHARTNHRAGRLSRAWVAPAVGLATSLGVYLLATGIVFRPDAFARHYRFVTEHPTGGRNVSGESYFSTPATIGGYVSLSREYVGHIVDSMGLPMALAAAAGLIVAIRRRPRLLIMAIPVVAVLFGIIMVVRFARIRFAFSAVYVLAMFAAVALSAAAGWFDRSRKDRAASPLRRRFAVAAIAVVIGWALLRAGDLTWQMLGDSRYELAEYIDASAVAGDRIAYYGSPLKLPHLPAGVRLESGPWDLAPVHESTGQPEFIVIVPQQAFETVHEWTLPEERFRELDSGQWNYELVFSYRGPSLFEKRPINWVNPPVRLYARRDRVPVLPAPDLD